jgi:hypothetical protein
MGDAFGFDQRPDLSGVDLAQADVMAADGSDTPCGAPPVAVLGIVHAGCWAHARRYFDDARKAHRSPQGSDRARTALDCIGRLYQIERSIKGAAAEVRLRVRTEHSAPIVAELRTWLEAMAPTVLPQGLLGKAVHYTLGQWPKLIRFLEHAELPLDNNRLENAIRPFVIGRKGWLFADTQAGARASANLYSLVETAKANGLEPHGYLTQLFTALPHASTVEHFEALLPWSGSKPTAAVSALPTAIAHH